MVDRQIYFDYLDHLHKERVNMAFAGVILQEVFGLKAKQAQIILIEWKRSQENS